MSNKKQTSIEWLIDQLKSIPLAKNKDEFTNGDIMDIVNEAKEMHKQEIIDAATWGTLPETPEQYYNEKYKQ